MIAGPSSSLPDSLLVTPCLPLALSMKRSDWRAGQPGSALIGRELTWGRVHPRPWATSGEGKVTPVSLFCLLRFRRAASRSCLSAVEADSHLSHCVWWLEAGWGLVKCSASPVLRGLARSAVPGLTGQHRPVPPTPHSSPNLSLS